jgi:murein DD-endopeptidase MepM/ murein hydrolase activator NlpD
MKRYLGSSLFALSVAVLIGSLIHFNNTSSVAHANFTIDLPITPLAQLADSLRTVTLALDAEIRELRQTDSTLSLRLDLPVESTELHEIANLFPERIDSTLPSIRPDAFQLSNRVSMQQTHIDSLNAVIARRQEIIEHFPLRIPCTGHFTSGFGVRMHPIDSIEKMHTGIDFGAPVGTSICASGSGVVSFAGVKNGYGNVIEVDHGYGYRTLYGHCSKLVAKTGDTVNQGDLIALVGSTGHSTGPHLHYEVIVDDTKVDPTSFLKEPPASTVAQVKQN